MEILTIQEVARRGGLSTAKKHKGQHAKWGRKGAKKRAENKLKRATELCTP